MGAARARRTGLGVATAALLLAAQPRGLRAFDTPGPDAACLSQGGACAASTEAGGAFTWNPALTPGPGASALWLAAGLRVDARHVTTRRWGDPADRTATAPLEPRVLADVSAQAPLRVLHLHAGAWYRAIEDQGAWFPGQSPEDPLVPGSYDRHRYGALRYRRRDTEYGLSLAWRPKPYITVGLAAVGRTLSLERERVLWAGTPAILAATPESTADDLRVRLDLHAPFVPEGRFGFFLRPAPPLRLGVSFALPGVARLRGTASLPPLPSGRVVTLEDEAKASLRLRLPWTLRVALGVDVGRLRMDAQLTLIDATRPLDPEAHTVGLLMHRSETPTLLVPISRVGLGTVTRRRIALATGARILVVRPWLELAIGYAFHQGESAPAWRSAALSDPDQHVVTGGIRLRVGPARLDVGYGRVFATSRGGPGEARQWNPVSPLSVTSIAAGRQTRNGDLVAATLSLALGPP